MYNSGKKINFVVLKKIFESGRSTSVFVEHNNFGIIRTYKFYSIKKSNSHFPSPGNLPFNGAELVESWNPFCVEFSPNLWNSRKELNFAYQSFPFTLKTLLLFI